MNKQRILAIVDVIAAVLCAYAFFVPTVFAMHGYALAIDGIVIARALCFVFGLYSIEQAVVHWLK